MLERGQSHPPSICIDADGHLLAFYGSHGGHHRIVRTTALEDVTEWEDLGGINDVLGGTSPSPFLYEDDDHQENRDDDENGEFVRHRAPGREQLVEGAELVGEADSRRDEDGPDDYRCGGPVLFETE